MGGCDWLACERHKDNRVVLENRPSTQPQRLCGSFLSGWHVRFSLNVTLDLLKIQNASVDIISFVKYMLKAEGGVFGFTFGARLRF